MSEHLTREAAVSIYGPDVTFTMGMVTMAHVINPSLRKSLPYDTLKDLAAVTQLSVLHLLVAAHPSLGANTPAELIAPTAVPLCFTPECPIRRIRHKADYRFPICLLASQ